MKKLILSVKEAIMKKTLYFIIAICALGLVSCEETGYRRTTAYHYVAAYYPIDTFSIALHITKRQQVINNNYIGLHFRGDYYSKYKKDNYDFQENVYSDYYENSPYKPSEEQYNKYVELCNKHEDYGYTHQVRYLIFKDKNTNNGQGYIPNYTYWDITPILIDVVSNADYDETHPAGTSLNDITLFTTFSPYPFIKNGYTGKEFVKNKKTLDKYTQDDFKLVFCLDDVSTFSEDLDRDNYGALTFAKEPTKSKEHTFTVTIKDDYGRTFTDSLTVTFK